MATPLFTGCHNCQLVEDFVHPYVFPHLRYCLLCVMDPQFFGAKLSLFRRVDQFNWHSIGIFKDLCAW